MYNFTGINQHGVDTFLPSVAMNFNGKTFESELDGYRTLTVSGRETISNELISHDVKNGTLTTNKRLPSRRLMIKYSLKGDDNNSFQSKFKALRRLLHSKEQVEITFLDEPDVFYFGQLSEMSDIPPYSNSVVGTFVVHCDSPYKHGKLIETNGSVTIDTFYETPPFSIKLTVTSATQAITITNGPQLIRLTGNFSANDLIVIDVGNGTVTRNGADHTYTVALNSDFENFVIQYGQTVSSPQGLVKLTARERWL